LLLASASRILTTHAGALRDSVDLILTVRAGA
jgi:hypothetical protein